MDDDDGLYDSGERGYIHVCTVLGHGCHNNYLWFHYGVGGAEARYYICDNQSQQLRKMRTRLCDGFIPEDTEAEAEVELLEEGGNEAAVRIHYKADSLTVQGDSR